MTDLEKVTEQRDLLLETINQAVKLSRTESIFNYGYTISLLKQVAVTVEKDMQNAR